MKKTGFLLIIAALACFLAGPAAAEEGDASFFISASGDFFSVDCDTERPQAGTGSKTDDESTTETTGDLTGGTLSFGWYFDRENVPIILSFDFSLRQGDFDSSHYYRITMYDTNTSTSVEDYASTKAELEREDIDTRLTFKFAGERWQPYFGLGYWKYTVEGEETITDYRGASAKWNATQTASRKIEKDVDAFLGAFGLGVNLGKLGPFKFALKSELGLMAGFGELKIEGQSVNKSVDGEDTAFGFHATGAGSIAYPFSMGESSVGQFFVDGGYQYQTIGFGDEVGEDTWYGPYGRAGVTLMF